MSKLAGQLTSTELLKRQFTGSKILFHLLFWGAHLGTFAYGWWKQASDSRLEPLNVTLNLSIWISRGAGLVLSWDTTLILLPVCHTILRWFRPRIKFLPLDENVWFHRQVAYAMLIFTIIHTAGHYVNFFNIEKTQIRPVTAVGIHYKDPGGITGHIMLLCLYTHAVGCFVRDTPEPFSPFSGKDYYDHCLGYLGWRWELVAGGLYFVERIYREMRAMRETRITRVFRHPYNVVEIQFVKPSFKYKPGQWLFLQVPSISRYQWHPFTITSCPFDPYVSVHVRQIGDFTRVLGDAVGAGQAQSELYADSVPDPKAIYEIALQNGQQMPLLRIDGPYGAPAEDVLENEIAILIGMGIGVTPWASVLKNIWHLRNGRVSAIRLRRVEFIWICKDTAAFEWFHPLLSSLEDLTVKEAAASPENSAQEFLRIHTYLTQKLDDDMAQNVVLNSVGSIVDPLTKLKAGTNFGRPDFPKLFQHVRDQIDDGTYLPGLERSIQATVGVYFCGPAAAAREIKSACRNVSTQDVKFKFWKEHF
ncbi:hypothetical protein FOXB_15603 [Fusarium oxysporum f. sp. conglutinans Fo5176]|uniref:FAD-binding FR-type domain-containing protein n=1 Tax=Fusarium oxysporum (strain Fo5176) TaxID=660025 RepID=F9GAC1_FUSOF|nr:hypothetical protein FOXB_15603 [Fusarium oxysporum f. sp. conglutinans Fo5176]